MFDCDNTNPGVVFYQGEITDEMIDYAFKAIYSIITIDEAEEFANNIGAEIHKFKKGRGIIGSIAAISCPLEDYTYELLAYRHPSRYGTVRNIDYDLIITGRQAIDGDTAQVGPQIAEHLGIPCVSYAASVDLEGEDTVVIQRNFEDRYHIIEAKTPLLITTLGEEIEPRYMTVGGIFDAYREKEVKVWGYEDLQGFVDDANLGLKGSPTQVKKSFTKPVKPAGQLYAEISADEAVEVIVNKLKEKYII